MSQERDTHTGTVLALLLGLATLGWWALAFYPQPATETADWLKAARTVCFGTLDNGLPDTWGWMILVFGPISFAVVLEIGWGRDIRAAIAQHIRRPTGIATAMMGFAATLAVCLWVTQALSNARLVDQADFMANVDSDLPETYPMTDKPAPDFKLVNQHGDNLNLESFKGRPLVLTFAFANCRTICPAILHQSRTALEAMPGEAALAVITLDPWRDTPAALSRVAEGMILPTGGHLLSGNVSNVVQTLQAYNMPWDRDEETGDVQHPALTYVIDGDGRIAYTFSNVSSGWLVSAVRRIAARTPGKS